MGGVEKGCHSFFSTVIIESVLTMNDDQESPYRPPATESAPEPPAEKRGLSPRLSFIGLVILTGFISFGLTFVWPGEDKSLAYLPRFLASFAIAAVLWKLLGFWPTPPSDSKPE